MVKRAKFVKTLPKPTKKREVKKITKQNAV